MKKKRNSKKLWEANKKRKNQSYKIQSKKKNKYQKIWAYICFGFLLWLSLSVFYSIIF